MEIVGNVGKTNIFYDLPGGNHVMETVGDVGKTNLYQPFSMICRGGIVETVGFYNCFQPFP